MAARRTRDQNLDEDDNTANHKHTRSSSSSDNKSTKSLVPLDLPITKCRSSIVALVKQNRAVIITADTGSGKTTGVPQFILDDVVSRGNTSGNLMVGITQPRRVAATSVAEFVAKCRGCACGEEVGYCVRFDEKTSSRTRLKFMTDGMLLRELLVDSSLSRYACIVLDEAHERTLNGDVLFGLLKLLFQRRKDLRIVVMSATLDSDAFSRFWGNCPVGYVSGRTFPVQTMYATEPQTDYVDASIITILQIHIQEGPGDVLCFLTGQEEIEDAKQVLEERRRFLPPYATDYTVVTLYAAMSPAQQMAAFAPTPKGVRKIVLATNVAETSITIDGIVYVVDCGLVKSRQFHTSGLETLQVVPGSRAQCRQRAGRAGRTQPGKCYRLFREEDFDRALTEQSVPEILRCNLSSVVLQMKAMGIEDVMGFEFMDRPSDALLLRSMEELVELGALDADTGTVTDLGKELVRFPVEPMEAKSIWKAMQLGCSDEVCVILAMMSVSEAGLFEGSGASIGAKVSGSRAAGIGGGGAGGGGSQQQHRAAADSNRAAFSKALGDHLTLLAVYEAWSGNNRTASDALIWCQTNGVNMKQMKKAVEIEVQLRTHCKRLELAAAAAKQSGGAASVAFFSQQQQLHNQIKPVPPYVASQKLRAEAAAEYPSIRRAFTAGFFSHAAFFDAKQREYRGALNKELVFVHPTSVLFNLKKKPALVLYHVVVKTAKSYMRDVISTREEWLVEEAPMIFARNTSS